MYILGGNIPVVLVTSLTQEPELGSYCMLLLGVSKAQMSPLFIGTVPVWYPDMSRAAGHLIAN